MNDEPVQQDFLAKAVFWSGAAQIDAMPDECLRHSSAPAEFGNRKEFAIFISEVEEVIRVFHAK